MKEITLDTKIADLLNNYENMKEILININPKFKKLNNPILRRTIAKLATVKQAAVVGGMDSYDLLNKLRTAVGQKPYENIEEEKIETEKEPFFDWVKNPANATLNANDILNSGKNPLAETSKILKELNKGEIVEIISDFRPEPLIDEFKKQGYETISYKEKEDDEKYITKIKK